MQFLETRRPRHGVAISPALVHAHKATAQPLELHAREDVAASDRVPPVAKGATAVPVMAGVCASDGLHSQMHL